MQNVTFTFDFKGRCYLGIFVLICLTEQKNKDWRLRLPPSLNPNTIADLVNLLTILVPRLISVARNEPIGFICMVRHVSTGLVNMASKIYHGDSFLIGRWRSPVSQQVQIGPDTAVSGPKGSF